MSKLFEIIINIPKVFKVNIAKILVSISIVTASLVSIQYLYYSIMPTSHWFEYSKVFAEAEYPLGTQPELTSFSIYKRKQSVIWNDVLRCPTINDGRFFSSYISQDDGIVTAPEKIMRNGFAKSDWVYQAEIPKVETSCFMRSTITVALPFGITKSSTIDSNIFTFVEE